MTKNTKIRFDIEDIPNQEYPKKTNYTNVIRTALPERPWNLDEIIWKELNVLT